ncbi:hypothetical protein [Fusobacterium polymorphum]|uniref:Uncharacterized protein n=1 Tax=Fusobacterium nucleatum subsp. polymorphum TaxID=76857 RepID=A0A2C6BGV4_FUSNP|nr:hypothetical protein [Fusobacterium polymorphum]PHI05726.1 hypothetical protein CBG54_00935 [Fusobacterium polymorphum]
MWVCKKCGEKIQGYYTGLVDIDKNGYAIDGTQEEEEVIKYFCGCDEHIRYRRLEELKRVADWEEEDERD